MVTASFSQRDDGNGSMKTVLADSTWTLFNFVIYFFESNVALHKTQVLKCVVSTKNSFIVKYGRTVSVPNSELEV